MKSVNTDILQLGSIRTRLVFFYTSAAFVLLALVALFLYWGMLNLLYKADYQFLSDEVDTIQYILDEKLVDKAALQQAVVDIPLQPGGSIYHYYIRVLDSKKNLIIETPGMSEVLQVEKYLHKSSEILGKKRFFWYTKNNKNYMLIESPIKLSNNKTSGAIFIALDVSYQHSVINDRKKLLAALLVGILSALALGFVIAQRGLKSLLVLTKTVQDITAHSLNKRIDPKSWPIELSALGVAFNDMLDRVETSFVRLKQFSADLSHELRTPISNLIGQTEIALSYDKSVADYRQVMESNLEELHRISSLMENILFLAKAENPQIDLKKTDLDVNKEISHICEYYQPMADEKNIHVFCEGEAHLSANSVMFRRMISNILSNALKYTPAGGSIRFNISKLDDATMQIIVSDNGMGIAPEHLPKIFDRFYRTDAARTQKLGGTGLGLAIVKSIVDLHHGTIKMMSELNVGTTILITFPVGILPQNTVLSCP